MNWYGGPAVPQLATYSNSHVPPRASEELLAWQLNAATIAQGDLARTDFEHNANELKLGLSVEGNAALETFDPQGRGESLNGTALGRTVPHEPDDTSRAAALPSLADNLPQVATAYLRDVNAWRAAEEVRVRRFAQVILVGSGSLLVGLAMLLVWQLAGRAAIWLPAGSVATATLLLCSVWLGMSLDRPLEITRKAVPNFSPERGLAKLRIEDTEETSYKVARPELDARFKESLFESGEALQREEREVHLPVVIASGGTSASGASEHARERRFAVPYADQWAKKDRPTEFDFARPDPNAEFADELDEQEESLADVRERWEWSHLAGLETISRTSQATVPLREQVPSMLAINQSTNPSQPAASTPATGPDSTAPAPTVYWNPDLVTDKNGQAHVSFELPQRNVRYRLMIDAHGNGRIGSHSQIIVAE
jgi:hypothetical protein